MRRYINYFIAAVWLINGLYCKVLSGVPRHEQIVARILGSEYAHILTVLIGLAEIAMCIWVLSGYKSRINALTQMLLVVTMNIIEFFLAPDLLLWGQANAFFAACFVCIVYANEFKLLPITGTKN